MKAANFIITITILLVLISCDSRNNNTTKPLNKKVEENFPSIIPLDKGFSEYISEFTSGIIPANSAIEIRFTPEFAAKADKSASGLFVFEPSIKGKSEWKDETTLVFKPSHLLAPGKTFTGTLNLNKLSEVKERLKNFPLRIQTARKDFQVTIGALECSSPEGSSYELHGEIISADFHH